MWIGSTVHHRSMYCRPEESLVKCAFIYLELYAELTYYGLATFQPKSQVLVLTDQSPGYE